MKTAWSIITTWKKVQKQQFFAPFQSYICSNKIHRYKTSVKSNSRHDGDLHIAINFQEIRHICQQNYHNICIICLHVNIFRALWIQEKTWSIILLSASECEESDIFVFATYSLNLFQCFHFLLQPRFCLCNMSFLIFYLSSRDKTPICFHSFLENLMWSQRETRYHYQNLIEHHEYLFRFELIPLDSSLLHKDHIQYLS